LNQARVLAEGVKDMFMGRDIDAAARLGDITTRLNDERDYVNRLILATDPNGDLAQKP
jgi:hypothetical protein